MTRYARISGTGSCLPPQRLTNADMVDMLAQRGVETIDNWIVERTFAWLGRHRRLSKDYEFRVQTSETLITIAACALMLKRLAPS